MRPRETCTTAAKMGRLVAQIGNHRHVADVRQAGMIVAFEFGRDGDKSDPFDPAARFGLHAYRAALDRGVLLRPLGDILYWMPPYTIDDDGLELLADTTRAVIDQAIGDTGCA